MATTRIYITGYSDLARDAKGNSIAAGLEPAVEERYIDIDTDDNLPVQLAAPLADATRFIEVCADVDCHIAIGDDPDASQDQKKLYAGSSRFYGLSRKNLLLSVIREAP